MISLSVRVKGYHLSARNLSVDQLNPFQLIGRVDRDITNLVFMLEKGPDPLPDYTHMDPDYNELRQRPLRGAEGAPDHSREVDSSPGRCWTAERNSRFKISASHRGRPTISTRQRGARCARWTAATVFISPTSAGALRSRSSWSRLKVICRRCDLASAGDATNVDFVLKSGSGPAGTVVEPDGRPAAGATLVLLGRRNNRGRAE